VTSEDSCNIPNCFHVTLQGIYSCQHHCAVVCNDTKDLLICYIYLYYWYHLGTSFIRTAVLLTHYAVVHPLQFSPCQEVHPEVVKLSPEQPSNIELLCLPWGRVPWFWFLAWGWLIHINSGFNFMCSGSWHKASGACTLPRNTPCTVTMSNCILSGWEMDVSIDVADQQPYWLLHKGHSFNALSLINVYHILHCLDCIQQEKVPELCWCHHISFPSMPT